jgi:probable rRNA maturation factor
MILNRQCEVRVARPVLDLFLRRAKRELGLEKSDVTVCLVTDKAMARLNREFRKKVGPTDVLSFPGGERSKASAGRKREAVSLGDIAIAPATARRYARKHGRPLAMELRVLILHGLLHLLGYDHETDHGEMDRIEQRLRRRFGLK